MHGIYKSLNDSHFVLIQHIGFDLINGFDINQTCHIKLYLLATCLTLHFTPRLEIMVLIVEETEQADLWRYSPYKATVKWYRHGPTVICKMHHLCSVPVKPPPHTRPCWEAPNSPCDTVSLKSPYIYIRCQCGAGEPCWLINLAMLSKHKFPPH